MSPRAFLSLAAATALAVVGAAVLIVVQQNASNPRSHGGDPMFAALIDRIGELRHVAIETSQYKIALESRGDGWIAVDRGDYPVKTDRAIGLVHSVAEMTTVEPKTANADWYQYIDVAGPTASPKPSGARVSVTAANGDVLADAIIGRPSASIGFDPLGGTFVRRSDETQAWLVEGTADVPGFLQDWFDYIVHVPGPDVVRVAILAGDEVLLDAEKVDPASGDYELVHLSQDVGPEGSTANDNEVRGMTQAIVSLAFDDVRSREGVSMAEDARTVRFVTRTGLELMLSLGEVDGETWVVIKASAQGPDATESAAQVSARTADWAFKLPGHKMAVLTKPIEDLFSPPAADVPPPPDMPMQPGLPQVPGLPLVPGLSPAPQPPPPPMP